MQNDYKQLGSYKTQSAHRETFAIMIWYFIASFIYLFISDWILNNYNSDPVLLSMIQRYTSGIILSLIGFSFYFIIYKQIKTHIESSMNLNHVFSELKDKNEKLTELESNHYQLAYYDSLTGLINKNKLEQKTQKLINQRIPFAIFYIDIDNFGVINQIKGYAWGDNALFEIAQELKKNSKGNLVARISDDGFVVVFENISDKNEIELRAQKILEDIKILLKKQSEAYFYTASGGISLYPSQSDQFQDLLRYATLALGEAKRRGKDRIMFYSEEMQILKEREVFITNQILHSIIKDHFYVVYQPIFDFKTKKLVCVEALLRWQHPELGNIPPNDFIYLAEISGSIVDLTDIVTEKVFSALDEWKQLGIETRASINISGKVLMYPNLVDKLNQLSDKYQIDKSLIVIEVTESVLLDNIEVSLCVLQRLKSEGYIIALDDFGSGYSSLNYLKHLPIDVLKIDKSYISNIHEHENERHFLKFVVDLAHVLNKKVVLEGVEKSSQEEILESFNIDYVQGFYYARPMTGSKIIDHYKIKDLED